MIPLTNLSSTPAALPTLNANESTASSRVKDLLHGLSLTILGPTGQIEGPGGEIRLRLETPTIGPEDIPLNEFLQQLDGLESIPAAPLMLDRAVEHLASGSRALAQATRSDPPIDAKTAAALATSIETQATNVQRSLRDIIENSTYPNFSDFLKDLVKIAQQLRESATKAKMAAIQSNYDLMTQAADKMLEAANQAKESRDKQIAAERKEAIGQIVAGGLSILIGIGFLRKFGSQIGSQLSSAFSQATNSLITGSTGVSASSDKTLSSELQLESDLANVAKQRLEAAAKLIEQQTAVADDLRDIAKGLRDMVLKVYQDFISSQNQTLQRANV